MESMKKLYGDKDAKESKVAQNGGTDRETGTAKALYLAEKK